MANAIDLRWSAVKIGTNNAIMANAYVLPTCGLHLYEMVESADKTDIIYAEKKPGGAYIEGKFVGTAATRRPLPVEENNIGRIPASQCKNISKRWISFDEALNFLETGENTNTRLFMAGDNACEQIDVWIDNGSATVVGRSIENPNMYYILNNGSIFEFDHLPNKDEVFEKLDNVLFNTATAQEQDL